MMNDVGGVDPTFSATAARRRRRRSAVSVLKARWSPIFAVVVCIFTEDVQRCTGFVLPRPPANHAICPARKRSLLPQSRQQHFVRLLSQQSTDNQGIGRDSIEAIEEAKALRRKARALVAEAEAAESKLRNETLSRKNQVDAELDVFIDDLVAVTSANLTGIDQSTGGGVIDEDLIEQRRTNTILTLLRSSDSMPTTRLLRVVERIHERERLAGDAVDWDNVSVKAGNYSEEAVQKMALGAGLGGLAHSLIEAVSLLEEERSTITDGTIDATETSSNNVISLKKEVPRRRFGIASDAAPKLRARMKELRRADEEVINRKFASLANMMRRGVKMVNDTERASSTGNVTRSMVFLRKA